MKYCSACGAEHNDNAVYCSSCGTKFNVTNESKNAASIKLASDPSLTKNIVLISFCGLFILVSVLILNNLGVDGIRSQIAIVFWAVLAGILGFLAIRPSFDHIDTEKMDLLKTVEAFCIAVAGFIVSCFAPEDDFVVAGFLLFSLLFSSMVAYKINKKEIASRNLIEKVTLALSTVIIIIDSLACFGALISLLFI